MFIQYRPYPPQHFLYTAQIILQVGRRRYREQEACPTLRQVNLQRRGEEEGEGEDADSG
jgi:hypothetical protein